MNIEVTIRTNEYGSVFVEETRDSARKRISDTYGFKRELIHILEDDEHYINYNGSLVEECYITVNGIEYHIKFDYLTDNNTIISW